MTYQRRCKIITTAHIAMYTYVAAAVMTPITAITYVSESARRDILEVYSTVSIILLLTSELKRSHFFWRINTSWSEVCRRKHEEIELFIEKFTNSHQFIIFK